MKLIQANIPSSPSSPRSLLQPLAPSGARAPLEPVRPPIHPIAALGFRPFFLLAGAFGALAIPLWLLALTGSLTLPARVPGMSWHGHEMIFGFTVAVVAGFLLTAVRNWTQQPTPSGGPLLALAGLWVLGRLGLLFGGLLPPLLVEGIELAFIPALALALAIPLWKSTNRRNYAFVGLLLALFGANLLFHLGGPAQSSLALKLAVDVIVLIVAVMGGRVIPMFTKNAVPGVKLWSSVWVDRLAFGATGLVLVLELMPAYWQLGVAAAFLAALAHGVRLSGWGGQHTLRRPILWVLHLGYAFVPLGFMLKGLAFFVPTIPVNAPLHALTVGAMGVLTLGMMARVSLGHTGRMLEVGRPMAVAFGLLGLAAFMRAVLPILLPGWYLGILVGSGLSWSVGFLIFVWVYWPILSRPRVDGKPG